jgi:putative DNA primase/helicase
MSGSDGFPTTLHWSVCDDEARKSGTPTCGYSEHHSLKGARMVCASETEEGRQWAEVRIKQVTGGDRISARFMRQDFFEFMPQFKLTIIGNHQPELRNVDDAAKRRVNMAPFLHKPPKPDKDLEEKLKSEWPAILRWMIDGCLDWQANGLIRPAVVTTSTAEYFDDQDLLTQWVEECCERTDHDGRPLADTIASLLASWRGFSP